MTGGRGRAVVVGGGVIGAACAHFLNGAGREVVVLDRGKFGAACSHGNCGLVCPSHVLPLAEPGAIKRTLPYLLRRNAPFAIKPRFDPALWKWFYRFFRRCNERDMKEAASARHALLTSSMAIYKEMMASDRLDCEWQERGLLFAYRSRRALDEFGPTNEMLSREFGERAERIEGDALIEMEPALKPGLAGGWFYAGDAHLRPDRLMASWRRLLVSRGVEVREGCEVSGFSRQGGRAVAIATSSGEVRADEVVVAAGALTPSLAGELGARIPIQPGKGYSITMPRPSSCPRIPIIFPETRVAVTPMVSGYRLGSTMEFAGYDDAIEPRRLRLLTEGVEPYLREPTCEPVEERWLGWRPMTWDGKPIIDRSPALSNVWIAAGHNMLGLSMAPATGRLVSELIAGSPPHVDPTPYRVDRF